MRSISLRIRKLLLLKIVLTPLWRNRRLLLDFLAARRSKWGSKYQGYLWESIIAYFGISMG